MGQSIGILPTGIAIRRASGRGLELEDMIPPNVPDYKQLGQASQVSTDEPFAHDIA